MMHQSDPVDGISSDWKKKGGTRWLLDVPWINQLCSRTNKTCRFPSSHLDHRVSKTLSTVAETRSVEFTWNVTTQTSPRRRQQQPNVSVSGRRRRNNANNNRAVVKFTIGRPNSSSLQLSAVISTSFMSAQMYMPHPHPHTYTHWTHTNPIML